MYKTLMDTCPFDRSIKCVQGHITQESINPLESLICCHAWIKPMLIVEFCKRSCQHKETCEGFDLEDNGEDIYTDDCPYIGCARLKAIERIPDDLMIKTIKELGG